MSFFICNGISVLIYCRFCVRGITIDRIRSQIATGIQLVNLDRCTTVLFNVNRDRTSDGSSLLVTAEYLRVVTIGDSDMHIIEDVGILRSAIELIAFSHTVKHGIGLGVNKSLFTTCVSLIGNQRTITNLLYRQQGLTTDVTLLVTTAIHTVDISTVNRCRSNTRSNRVVGDSACLGCCIRIGLCSRFIWISFRTSTSAGILL